MGLTVKQLIDRTRLELLGGARLEMNSLATAITDSPAAGTQETITISYPLNGIIPTSYITIDEEDFYVFAVNTAAQTATVARGENSTPCAPHLVNARVYVNDPFPRSMVMNALQDEIRSWGPQVFAWDTLDIPLIPGTSGYDLGAVDPWFGVIDARITPDPNIDAIDTKAWRRVSFKEYHGLPVSDFPSGNGIILTEADGASGWNWNITGINLSLHVTYAHPFDVDTTWAETTDLVSNCGLDPSDQDIPQLGAMWRLLRGREARRAIVNIAGDPREDSEVPPLYISKTAAQFKAERDSRLWDAQTRLARQFPTLTSA